MTEAEDAGEGAHPAVATGAAGLVDRADVPEPTAPANVAEPIAPADVAVPTAPADPAKVAAPGAPDAPASPPRADAPAVPRSPDAPPTPAAPGPVAEPQVPSGRFLTAMEVRPILNATRPSWIHVREYAGRDLLYVTHLWSWRCGLAELRVGLNGAPPEVWPLPPCHPELPVAATILDTDGAPYRDFPRRSVQLIEVQLTYDDLTTVAVRFNRAGVVIP